MIELRYYLRCADQTVWAIFTRDGEPLRAIGPVDNWQDVPAVKLDIGGAVDASGWKLAEFTPADNSCWRQSEERAPAASVARAAGHFDTRRRESVRPPGPRVI